MPFAWRLITKLIRFGLIAVVVIVGALTTACSASGSSSTTGNASPASSSPHPPPPQGVDQCFRSGERILVTHAGILQLEIGSNAGGITGADAGGDVWQYVFVPAGFYEIEATLDTRLSDDLKAYGTDLVVAALKPIGATTTPNSVEPSEGTPTSVIFADEAGLEQIGAVCKG